MAKKLLCTRCLTVGKPKFEMPGNPAFADVANAVADRYGQQARIRNGEALE